MDEQSNPWGLLQSQDTVSRHRKKIFQLLESLDYTFTRLLWAGSALLPNNKLLSPPTVTLESRYGVRCDIGLPTVLPSLYSKESTVLS